VGRERPILLGLCVCVASACATAPKETEATRRVAANPPAIVEGRVRDAEGHPVAGIGVRGIPAAKDVPWSPVVETGCDGRFRLTLAAPATYSFVLLWHGTGVITPDPRDPSRESVSVAPATTASGVELVFLAADWRDAAVPVPATTPSCPETPAYNSPR
jgi:hypothetical protein